MLNFIKSLLYSKARADRSIFVQSLEDCFENANNEIYTRSHGYLENRAYRYFKSENRLPMLSRMLESQAGITGFTYVGCGDNAVVVQYAPGQVLRFRAPAVPSDVNTHSVIKAPFICPVWKEVFFHDGRLNFVPYIRDLTQLRRAGVLSSTAAEAYVLSLLCAGFSNRPSLWFFDYKKNGYKFEQIGLIGQGTPVIIDQGAVIQESDAPESQIDRLEFDKEIARSYDGAELQAWDQLWTEPSGVDRIDLLPRPSETILNLPNTIG